VTRILEQNVQSGTGTAAALSGRPAAGKTGTTDSFADAWFAGFVPQLTRVAWVGDPQKETPLPNVHGIAGVTGDTLPAQIWHAYMTAALQGERVVQFPSPGSPPFQRWCGRFQFARTWREARKSDSCPKGHTHTTTRTKTHRKTVTVKTTTATATTQTRPSTRPGTTTRPATTTVPPTTTEPPPTTTTEPTTTTSTGEPP